MKLNISARIDGPRNVGLHLIDEDNKYIGGLINDYAGGFDVFRQVIIDLNLEKDLEIKLSFIYNDSYNKLMEYEHHENAQKYFNVDVIER